MDETEACRREVLELHQFFQDWARGVLPSSDEAFARLSDVVADGFEIISPDGRVMKRSGLLAVLRDRNGAERGRNYRIWIENPRGRAIGSGLYLVVYEEWQELDGEVKGRLSTAIFRAKTGTPNGVAWLHVHETWLP